MGMRWSVVGVVLGRFSYFIMLHISLSCPVPACRDQLPGCTPSLAATAAAAAAIARTTPDAATPATAPSTTGSSRQPPDVGPRLHCPMRRSGRVGWSGQVAVPLRQGVAELSALPFPLSQSHSLATTLATPTRRTHSPRSLATPIRHAYSPQRSVR